MLYRLFLCKFIIIKVIISVIGKTVAAKMPIFKLSPSIPAILPANVGPPAQPTSPASARNANIAVPPPFIEVDASLYVPGQSMPTENPDTAIQIKPTIADDENDTVKYESTHKQPLKTIILYRLIFSPNLP